MSNSPSETRLRAHALFEIRILLAGYLGSTNEGDPAVRRAAHLAYALHNEALAVTEGRSFSIEEALQKLAAVDAMFGEQYARRFRAGPEPH
jgi:hypothetical protein